MRLFFICCVLTTGCTPYCRTDEIWDLYTWDLNQCSDYEARFIRAKDFLQSVLNPALPTPQWKRYRLFVQESPVGLYQGVSVAGLTSCDGWSSTIGHSPEDKSALFHEMMHYSQCSIRDVGTDGHKNWDTDGLWKLIDDYNQHVKETVQ